MNDNESSGIAIPAIVRRRAENLGAEGLAWLRDLEGTVERLRAEWGLNLGAVLHGGSEAFVAEAMTPDGRKAVLKVGIPGSDAGGREARVLIAAGGRGYAGVFRHDESRRAMLLERLGPLLHDLQLPIEEQIRVICATLKVAWRRPPPATGFQRGDDKAESLAEFIEEMSANVEHSCSPQTIDRAFEYAESRRKAFSFASAVLAHGDAHASNTLRVPGRGPRRFKFIDPDGIAIEPAYDLAILMRGWSAQLLAGDAAQLGWERALFLGELTGVDPRATWEWGYIERISTGLLLKELGQDADAAECLAVAEQWAGRR